MSGFHSIRPSGSPFMRPYLISSSILNADFFNLGKSIAEVENAGSDWLHIDVMDGHFVPNITMGPMIVETIKKSCSLPIDVHLMIEKPEQLIRSFAESGADRISIHIENNPNVHRTLQEIKNLGCKTGIVLNPGTPANAIEAVLPMVDLTLVMTVNPGFGGQRFISDMVEKIMLVRSMIDSVNPDCYLQVDGGISSKNIKSVHEAGANVFVVGSAIFQNPKGITQAIQDLRTAIG